MVVWERSHAFCDDVAGKAELHGYATVVEMLFQVIIQAAHVAQPVWPEVQNLLRLCRIVHLQPKTILIVLSKEMYYARPCV